MLKSGGVVIHMRPSSDDFSRCVPSAPDFESFKSAKPFEVFDEHVIDFLDALSKSILADKTSRLYPDVMTFAFWIRKAHLVEEKRKFCADGDIRLGRGVSFHIAPGNVPINFAYSYVAGLLSGNASVVRLSSKPFPQVDLLCRKMEDLLSTSFIDMKPYTLLVQYDRTRKDITDYFSSIADIRVIWGGDSTIEEIRKSPLPPRSSEICFADRYSMSVINSDEIVRNQDKLPSIARDFYNDTFLFDQNACTAPHLVIWTGTQTDEAKDLFWTAVHDYTKKNYEIAAVTSVDKLTAFCRESIEVEGVYREPSADNLILRIALNEVFPGIEDYRSISGYFNEVCVDDIKEISSIVDRKYQTLSYYGVDKQELMNFVIDSHLVGIDRVVPIGKTMDFDLIWDGYDLIRQMSRVVCIW